jgi:ATP-dependent DNA helicase RecG
VNTQEILNALNLGESKDWEFKSAKGGLPRSLWETYSAMANTDGGVILLGVENDGTVSGLGDAATTQANFWSTVNNRGHVSANLLTNDQVHVEKLVHKDVLVVEVPRANRRQRPVYIGQNPLDGTYRRNFEGDYHCSRDEVGRMLADQAEEPADSLILPNFGLDDLDDPTVSQYRNRFSARTPQHPWLAEGVQGLLEKLGGWRVDRNTGEKGITIAGLLMFGKDEAIRDPNAVPQFHLDYREKLSDDPKVRWTDRLTIDGTWVGNLFQFYQKVIQRLTTDLKVPFKMQPDLFRKDDTIIHEAIRESLVNSIIHSDFRGQGGIVVEKYRNRLEISNPGTLLVSLDQLLKGGVSECRNKSLQLMFLMIGGGEKAGSGIDKIRQGWRSQHWRSPAIQQRMKPDRVMLILPMVSLLPEESVEKLRRSLGKQFDELSNLERQALVTAEVEGEVSNGRLREICADHPTDITQMLQGLVSKGMLNQYGKKRGATYGLSDQFTNSTYLTKDSTNSIENSTQIDSATPHIPTATSPESDPKLLAIASPARSKGRLPTEEMRKLILDLCVGVFLTPRQLGELLDRQAVGLQQNYLREMVQCGMLELRFPEELNHPNQAYTTKTATTQS